MTLFSTKYTRGVIQARSRGGLVYMDYPVNPAEIVLQRKACIKTGMPQENGSKHPLGANQASKNTKEIPL